MFCTPAHGTSFKSSIQFVIFIYTMRPKVSYLHTNMRFFLFIFQYFFPGTKRPKHVPVSSMMTLEFFYINLSKQCPAQNPDLNSTEF